MTKRRSSERRFSALPCLYVERRNEDMVGFLLKNENAVHIVKKCNNRRKREKKGNDKIFSSIENESKKIKNALLAKRIDVRTPQ